MSDLIDRQAAIKEIRRTYEYEFPTASGAFDEFVTQIVPNVLRNLPAAEPRKGKWVEVYLEDGILASRCTACGELDTGVPLNYCPNCGARMEE